MNEFDERFERETEHLPDDDGEIVEVFKTDPADVDDEDGEIVEPTAEAEEETPAKPFANAMEWVCTIVYTVAAIIILNLFFLRGINVDGTSMCNTLQDNDFVITTNFAYKPSFGDIVVIRTDRLVNSDTGLYGEPIIKRVIGVEGDTIRVDLEKGEVYRNGELLTEDYIIGPTNQKYNGWIESNTDYVVPENCVFVMGDNRKVSHDSRDLNLIGFIDENLIMGKALFRLFPISEMKWL